MKRRVISILCAAMVMCTLSPMVSQACGAWRGYNSRIYCATPLCNGKDLSKFKEQTYVRDCTTAGGTTTQQYKTDTTFLSCCY